MLYKDASLDLNQVAAIGKRKAHGSNSSELAASSKTANSGHVEPTKQPLSKFLKACCCNQLPVDLQSKVDLKTQPFAT